MVEDVDDPLIGQVLLGKLEVVRMLGKGGMGAVYEVVHKITEHHRALKVLHADFAMDAEVVQRFLREASVAGRLDTPYVVETFDAGQLEDGSPYVLMEMMKGETLDDALKGGELTQSRLATIVSEACRGLAAAHAEGIVHRDLKPENIFVAETHDGPSKKRLRGPCPPQPRAPRCRAARVRASCASRSCRARDAARSGTFTPLRCADCRARFRFGRASAP